MSYHNALALFSQGHTAAAERTARAAIERVPTDVEALQVLGLVAMRAGDTAAAFASLERARGVDPRHAMTHHYIGRVHDAAGNPLAAAEAHAAALRLQPELHVVRLHLGAALERAGQREQSAIQYVRALNDAQGQGRWTGADTTPAPLRPLVEHAVQVVRATRRAAFEMLFVPLRARFGADSLGRVEHALRFFLHEEVPQFPDERQRPSFLYVPGLPTAPYFERDLFAWIETFEASTAAIQQELHALLPSAAGRERVFTSDELEQANLRGTGMPPTWNGYYFYRHGERRDDNCASCPATARALDALPLSRVREHGPEVLFSVFTAGTHLLPHRGVTNTRVVGHLPLIVPRDCALRVGGELHEWREGRTVVFDDTYEHEAWNRSDSLRVVLIFDLWNPHLTAAEQLALAELVAAIGDFRKVLEAA